MKKVRVEKIGDINSKYSYLEAFVENDANPFLDIGISDNRELVFTIYTSKTDVSLSVEDWEYILNTAKDFLPKELKNEDDFLKFYGGE